MFSCGDNSSGSSIPDLTSADKIELMYKSGFDSSGKMGVKTIDITDRNEIFKIAHTVSSEPFSYQYCISTGSMTFYKNGSVMMTLVYNTSDDYRHIAYSTDSKLTAVKLSEENARLLEKYMQ